MHTPSPATLDPQLQLEAAKVYREFDGNIVIQQSLRNQLPLVVLFFLSILGAGTVNAYYPGESLVLLSFLPALVCAAAATYKVWNSRVVLAPEYLLYIHGILSWQQRSIRLEYARIQEIELRETILQKLLGIGDVIATPISTSMEDMIALNGVRHPRLYKDLIRDRIEPTSADQGVHAPPHIHAVSD